MHHFIQWITFDPNNFGSGQHNNYFAYFDLIPNSINNTIKVNFSVLSNPGTLTGVKINVLLVSMRMMNGITAQYSTFSYDGLEDLRAQRRFQPNFGIPASSFGPNYQRYCLHGATLIDNYVDVPALSNLSAYFLFQYNGNNVTNLNFS